MTANYRLSPLIPGLLVLALVAPGCETGRRGSVGMAAVPTPPEVFGDEAFDRHFVQVDTLFLPETPLIGHVDALDIHHDGRVLVTDAHSLIVLLLDGEGGTVELNPTALDGKHGGEIGYVPSYFRAFPDVPVPDATDAQIDALNQGLKESTTQASLFRLTPDALLIRYFNWYNRKQDPDREQGISIIDLEGHFLLDEEILTNRSGAFNAAAFGRIYRVRGAEMTADGELPNPSIEVYTVRPERLRRGI